MKQKSKRKWKIKIKSKYFWEESGEQIMRESKLMKKE